MTKRLTRKVVAAVPWAVGEGVMNGIVGIGQIFLLTWLLKPVDMGHAAIVMAIVGTIEILASMGISDAVVGAPSSDTRLTDSAFTGALVLASGAAIVSFLVAGPVGRFYDDPLITDLIRVAAIIPPLNALLAVPSGLLARKMRAAALTLRMTLGRLALLVSTAIFAYLHFGAWAIIFGNIVGALVSGIVLLFTMSRWPRLRYHHGDFKSLVRFGGALSFERLVWSLMTRFFWLIIGYIHGPTILGYFQFAQRLVDETANLVQTFSIRFGLSIFAALKRAGRDPTEAFLNVTHLITLVASPIFMGIAVVMPDTMGTIFDARWARGVEITQLAALGWVIAFPRSLVGPALRAQGHQSSLVIYSVICCIVTLAGGFMTSGQTLHFIGLAWVARHLIGLPWSFYAIDRYLKISAWRQITSSARPFLATVFMGVIVYALSRQLSEWPPMSRLGVLCATGALSYLALVALLDRTTVGLLVGQIRRARGKPA
ncbi:oligosaccharide flippase family protein [Rhizobium sp. RAF56]|uniref:oligosaccharide flippase family protein n=1 Tax=Rhizobium sp. RAF56 TaxID=3233062 RepID=UPI003F9DA870